MFHVAEWFSIAPVPERHAREAMRIASPSAGAIRSKHPGLDLPGSAARHVPRRGEEIARPAGPHAVPEPARLRVPRRPGEQVRKTFARASDDHESLPVPPLQARANEPVAATGICPVFFLSNLKQEAVRLQVNRAVVHAQIAGTHLLDAASRGCKRSIGATTSASVRVVEDEQVIAAVTREIAGFDEDAVGAGWRAVRVEHALGSPDCDAVDP